jgi:hypothetical protein
MRAVVTLLLCATLAACAAWPPDDTARMPNTALGGPEINQDEAIALSAWALRDPANTRGDPARAARAIAAEDWLAGQTMLTEDFGPYAPMGEPSWNLFRLQVRAAVGVAPGTPSQVVVDKMLAASKALAAGDRTAAAAQFQPPAFTLGPQGTLAALGNLPAFPDLEWAFTSLRRNESRGFGRCSGKC